MKSEKEVKTRACIYLTNHVESEIIGHQSNNNAETRNSPLLTRGLPTATTATTIHHEPSSTKNNLLIISTIARHILDNMSKKPSRTCINVE